MKYTVDTEVEFVASLGFVGADRTKVVTLEEIGFTHDVLETMTEEEVEEAIEKDYEDWLTEIVFMHSCWDVRKQN